MNGRFVFLIAITLLVGTLWAVSASARIPEGGEEGILTPGMETVWREGKSALDGGDLRGTASLLEAMARERNRLGPLALPEFSSLLVLEGRKALEAGNPALALLLGKSAADFSPAYAPAYPLQARALIGESVSRTPDALLILFRGTLASFGDFWALLHFLGILTFILLAASLLIVLTYGVILVLRAGPFYHHLFKEITGDFSPAARISLWGILLLLTLTLHVGWGLVFWISLAWVYLPRRERFWASLMVLFLLVLPYASPYMAFLYNAGEDPFLRMMVAARDGAAYSAPVRGTKMEGVPEDIRRDERWKTAEAILAGRLQHWNDVQAAYGEILRAHPDSRIALVNTGNASFHLERFDEAMEYYKIALDHHPDSAAAAFNLSQTYKEKLLFAEGKRTLDEALRLDRERVEGWIERARTGRGFIVVDETLPGEALWQTALERARLNRAVGNQVSRALFSLPQERLPLAGGGILLAFILLSFLKGQTPMAYACPQCGKVVCGRCIGSRFYGHICRECRAREKAGVVEEYRGKETRLTARSLWAFLVPGSLMIYRGEVIRGATRAFLFFAALTGLSIHNLWMVPEYYPTQGPGSLPWGSFFWILLLAGLFFSVLLELKILRIRFKS